MKKINFFYLSLVAGTLFTLGACNDKNDDVIPQKPIPEYVGLFVLNEGSGLNSGLGFMSYQTGTYSDNAVSVGAGGNDLIRYGSKLYITATNDNKVLVVEAQTKKTLETIQLDGPRFLLPYKGKVYVTNGNNQLTKIDTATYTKSSIEVGRSPEQLAATNGKIYVANSGWKDAATSGYDNRISVVNPNSFAVEKSITVAENISTIAADTIKNMLYVNAAAIYNADNEITSPSKLYTVNTSNDEVKPLNFGAEVIYVLAAKTNNGGTFGMAYMISSNYTDGKQACLMMNLDNQQIQTFANGLTAPYSIDYIPEIPPYGVIAIGDAKDYTSKGTVNFYDYSSGQLASTPLEVGVAPKKAVFSHSAADINKMIGY